MNSMPEIIKDEDFKHIQTHLTSEEIAWTVRNLNSLPKDEDYLLDSPPIVFQKATWCLRLYPNHRDEYGLYHIGLNIVRLTSSVPHHRLYYHLMQTDNVQGACLEVADFNATRKEKAAMTFDIGYEPRNRQRDIVRVICKISCCETHDWYAVLQRKLIMEEDTKDIGALCQNFKNVLLNGQNHDVVLKVKDKEFRAHQDILRARSPVLESMLSNDMFEKNSGVIDMPDCDPDAFEQFLFYLYSGEAETLDTGNVQPLYYIADKYDMGRLKKVCREFIKNSLTCANVCDVVQLALDHSDAFLMEFSTEFFTKEMRSVLRTVEWQSFMKHNPTQANELLIKATDSLYAGKI